jgi:hypothetical protein
LATELAVVEVVVGVVVVETVVVVIDVVIVGESVESLTGDKRLLFVDILLLLLIL